MYISTTIIRAASWENQQFAYAKTKAQISFAKLISAFVFATRIVQSLYFLNTKFHASSCLLLLCSPVCVGPVRKPHCWFSHEAAHTIIVICLLQNVVVHLEDALIIILVVEVPAYAFGRGISRLQHPDAMVGTLRACVRAQACARVCHL